VAQLAGLKAGDGVLDLGCGTGMLAIAFAKAGMAVTAMDPQCEMLVAVRSKAQAAGVAVSLVQGGSNDLTAQMGPFRLVTMGRAFHWMDRVATLTMLDQVIAPNGGVALFHDAHSAGSRKLIGSRRFAACRTNTGRRRAARRSRFATSRSVNRLPPDPTLWCLSCIAAKRLEPIIFGNRRMGVMKSATPPLEQ